MSSKLEYLKSDGINKPVLVSFPQNLPPRSFLAKNGEKDSNHVALKFELHQHQSKGHSKTIIVGQNDIMEYKGKSFTHDNLDKMQTSDYIVGILDKETNKIKLVDVAHLYTLGQRAKNANTYTPAQENLFKGVEYYDHKHELVSVFGTKKAKQRMQQLKNNVVEEDTINTAKQMNKILKQEVLTLMQDEENKDEVIDPESVLPEYNPEAQSSDDLYNRYLIIPKEINDFIKFKELYKAAKAGEDLKKEFQRSNDRAVKIDSSAKANTNDYHNLTIYSMKYLVEQEKSNEKVQHLKFRVRASIYLTYLVKFYKFPRIIKQTPKEVEESSNIPKEITERLLNTYAEITTAQGEGKSKRKFHYSKTKKLQDKLLCHIIILMLMIYDYQIDVKWIINALKIEFAKLVKYLRTISCTPRGVKSKPKEFDEEGEPVQSQPFQGFSEWALDKAGSLIVQLKTKSKKREKKEQSKEVPVAAQAQVS